MEGKNDGSNYFIGDGYIDYILSSGSESLKQRKVIKRTIFSAISNQTTMWIGERGLNILVLYTSGKYPWRRHLRERKYLFREENKIHLDEKNSDTFTLTCGDPEAIISLLIEYI